MIIEKQQQLTERSYSDCTFKGCQLIDTDLSGIQFVDCRFEGCSLTTVKLEKTRLAGVVFHETKCMGLDFTCCDPAFLSLSFDHARLMGCNFTDLSLKRGQFIDSEVLECIFVQCDLREGNFSGSKLKGSLFHNTRLQKADFRGAQDYTIDPLNNPVKGAHFSKWEALSLLEGLGVLID